VENHVHRPPRLGSRRSLNLRIGISFARAALVHLNPIVCSVLRQPPLLQKGTIKTNIEAVKLPPLARQSWN
jgi:hypothetical protein